MEHPPPASEHVIVERDGPIVTLTFNRPEARNAMTWDMYQRLYDTCEEVDADDSVRVLVLKGAGGKAFVAGTDIGQFTEFKSGEDGLRYERDGDQRAGRIARVNKPVIAQIQGFAVGGGFGIAAGADLRDRHAGRALRRADRAHARQLPVDAGLRALRRPARASRLKELIFTARLMPAEEALAAGFVHEIVAAEAIEARVRELAETVASHAPITLRVTKEAVRRIQEARAVPDGDDLIAATYGSADFHEGVRAFIEKRPARWTGK